MKYSDKIVLASSSPYRKELLKKLIPSFSAQSPDIDESPKPNETPLALSKRLALEKAQALSQDYPHHFIIGSDQVAMLGDTQLTKPGSYEHCVSQLLTSQGKTITFYTSLCVLNSYTHQYELEVDICHVKVRELTQQQIERYVLADKPYNCAASFKSEGQGIRILEKIEGKDPNALVGLPLILLVDLLKKFDIEVL